MRLDKWLQLSRLCKRRTVAHAVCAAGRARLGGRPAKPGAEVEPGALLTLDFGWRRLEVRVLAVPERGVPDRAAAAGLYEVLRDERLHDGPPPGRAEAEAGPTEPL